MVPVPTPRSLPQRGALTAVLLIFPVATVILPIAAEDAGNTAVGVGALELTGQADVDVCVGWGGEQGNSWWTEDSGRALVPTPGRERQAQGLGQQDASLERRLLWAELPRPGSTV